MDKRKGQQTWNHRTDATAPFVPSKKQIAKATAKLRKNWSEAEHHRRAGLVSPPVVVQQHSVKDLSVV